jgi:uncharacterized oxidoreductase
VPSILIDPERLAGSAALAADLARLAGGVKASPPAQPGGEILLPGEPQRRRRAARLASGSPLDAKTVAQLATAARRAGIAPAAIAAGLVEVAPPPA